jgi:hypothetical protein
MGFNDNPLFPYVKFSHYRPSRPMGTRKVKVKASGFSRLSAL